MSATVPDSASQNAPYNVFDFDPVSHVGPLPSPCINVCQMDPQNGLCNGCLRTIDEIVQWGNAGEAYKKAVWHELKARIDQVIFR